MSVIVHSDKTFWRNYAVKIIPLRAFAALAIVAAFTGFTNLAQAGSNAEPPIPSALLFESITDGGFSLSYNLTNTTPESEGDLPPTLINGFAVEFGLPPIDIEGPFEVIFNAAAPAGSGWSGGAHDLAAAGGFGVPAGLFSLPHFLFFDTSTDPIGPGESIGLFTLSIEVNEEIIEVAEFSNFVAFCDNGQGPSAPCVQGETTVPEPGALALFGVGLAGFGLMRRRRKMAA